MYRCAVLVCGSLKVFYATHHQTIRMVSNDEENTYELKFEAGNCNQCDFTVANYVRVTKDTVIAIS